MDAETFRRWGHGFVKARDAYRQAEDYCSAVYLHWWLPTLFAPDDRLDVSRVIIPYLTGCLEHARRPGGTASVSKAFIRFTYTQTDYVLSLHTGGDKDFKAFMKQLKEADPASHTTVTDLLRSRALNQLLR